MVTNLPDVPSQAVSDAVVSTVPLSSQAHDSELCGSTSTSSSTPTSSLSRKRKSVGQPEVRKSLRLMVRSNIIGVYNSQFQLSMAS